VLPDQGLSREESGEIISCFVNPRSRYCTACMTLTLN